MNSSREDFKDMNLDQFKCKTIHITVPEGIYTILQNTGRMRKINEIVINFLIEEIKKDRGDRVENLEELNGLGRFDKRREKQFS